MSEFEQMFPEDAGEQLGRVMRQAMGGLQQLMEERFEYRAVENMATCNELAVQGWTVLGIFPINGALLMQRKLGAADAASELLRQAARVTTPPSTPDDTPHNSQES